MVHYDVDNCCSEMISDVKCPDHDQVDTDLIDPIVFFYNTLNGRIFKENYCQGSGVSS